jgi:hypothetical protein
VKECEPIIVSSIAKRRFLRLKEPKLDGNISELPKKALKTLITDKVIKFDREACKQIVCKINKES